MSSKGKMSNLPEAEWSEEVNQAKALLEKEGFQVLNVGSICMIGAFNNHVHQIRGLLADKKILQEEFAEYKKRNPEPEFGRCENCEEPLDEDEHIFIFTRGDEDMTMCRECGDDTHEEMKADGWKRDDDEGEINHFEEDEEED
jgi:hypothetical protein